MRLGLPSWLTCRRKLSYYAPTGCDIPAKRSRLHASCSCNHHTIVSLLFVVSQAIAFHASWRSVRRASRCFELPSCAWMRFVTVDIFSKMRGLMILRRGRAKTLRGSCAGSASKASIPEEVACSLRAPAVTIKHMVVLLWVKQSHFMPSKRSVRWCCGFWNSFQTQSLCAMVNLWEKEQWPPSSTSISDRRLWGAVRTRRIAHQHSLCWGTSYEDVERRCSGFWNSFQTQSLRALVHLWEEKQ